MMSEINLEKKLKLGCVKAVLTENINKKLFGRILTLMDASAKDVEQRKALRSLISRDFTEISNCVMSELNNLPDEIVKI